MAQSRQSPRVWSDAIRGSEILADWVKLGSSAVLLWFTIGIALGALVGGFWVVEGTTTLDRKLWERHVWSSLGMRGRIADLPNPDGSGVRIQVPMLRRSETKAAWPGARLPHPARASSLGCRESSG